MKAVLWRKPKQDKYFQRPSYKWQKGGNIYGFSRHALVRLKEKCKVPNKTHLFFQTKEASFRSRSFVSSPAFWQSQSLTRVWCFLNSRTNSLAHLSGAMTKTTSLNRVLEWSSHLKQLIHSWRRARLVLDIAVLKSLWEGSSLQHSLACCRRHLFPIRKFSQEKQQNINIKYGIPRSLPIF